MRTPTIVENGKFCTEIESNGSKWAGESPDSIEKLLEVLKEHTIEERFFSSWWTAGKHPKQHWHCPVNYIGKEKELPSYEGWTRFFGNFEEVSHVFRITSNDPEVVELLTNAIKSNKGWKLYYSKNLVA